MSQADLIPTTGGNNFKILEIDSHRDHAGDLFVSFYDRAYGTCESTGCNDITLATSHDDGASWSLTRITTGSMPDLACVENPVECGLLGDYQGLAYANGKVFLAWADTRARGFNAPEQDVYFATLPVG